MISVYQGPAAFADVEANLTRLDRIAASAATMGSRLLVAPELWLTGYNLKERTAALAEPCDGCMVAAVREIAARHGLAIVVGFPERDGDIAYNAAMAVDADGRLAGIYRKVQLFGADEARAFRAGESLPVVDLAGLKVGLAICYDIEFPEVGRALARAGAELIAVPTANMMPFVEGPQTLVRARALENGVAVVYANHCGTEGELTYTGQSAIVAADGQDLARAGMATEALMSVSITALKSKLPLSTQSVDLRA